MSTLSSVILSGIFSDIPAFGIPGRIYFATDTSNVYRDSGTAWVSVLAGGGGGGGGSFTKIGQVVTSGSASVVNFSSIPNSFTSIKLIASGVGSASADLHMQINGDTGTNYFWTFCQLPGSSGGPNNNSYFTIGTFGTIISQLEMLISGYSSTTFQKAITSQSQVNVSGGCQQQIIGGYWTGTAAINSISISPVTGNFVNGSIFTLYGLE